MTVKNLNILHDLDWICPVCLNEEDNKRQKLYVQEGAQLKELKNIMMCTCFMCGHSMIDMLFTDHAEFTAIKKISKCV